MRIRHVGVAIGLLATAAIVAGCGEDGPGGSGGDLEVLTSKPSAVEGRAVTVRVPSGGITLTVGDPVTEAPADVDDIPSGQVLVPVQWSLERAAAAPFTGYSKETEIVVAAGDASVDLVTIPDTPGAGSEAWVLAPEDGADLGFEVTYDGVTQQVSASGDVESGAAAGLYDDAAAGVEQSCPASDFGLDQVVFECSVESWVLPYDPEQGWADDGQQFVAVQPRLNFARVVDGRERSAVGFEVDASRIDGVAPGAQLQQGTQGDGSVEGLLVAQVPTGTEHTWNADLGFTVDEGPRAGEQIKVAADITLG